MVQEKINVVALHNISSIKEDDGVKVFYSYPQDLDIIRSIKKLNYNVSSMFYEEESIENLKDCVVFNLCDALDTEDEIKLIEKLEENHIPHTGNSSFTTKLCQNKFLLKEVLKSNNINFPKGQIINHPEENLNGDLNYPLILKPIGEHGSNGIDEDSVIFNEKELREKVKDLILKFNKPVLAEEYIEGREFNIPLLGNENPETLAILEIDYSEHFENKPKILTYKAKWSKNSNDFKNTYSAITTKLNEDEENKIYETAISAYKAIKCNGYASVDLRMNDKGELFVIDINSNCYIAPESDTLKAAVSRGMTYEDLLNKILNYALERFNLKEEIELII